MFKALKRAKCCWTRFSFMFKYTEIIQSQPKEHTQPTHSTILANQPASQSFIHASSLPVSYLLYETFKSVWFIFCFVSFRFAIFCLSLYFKQTLIKIFNCLSFINVLCNTPKTSLHDYKYNCSSSWGRIDKQPVIVLSESMNKGCTKGKWHKLEQMPYNCSKVTFRG